MDQRSDKDRMDLANVALGDECTPHEVTNNQNLGAWTGNHSPYGAEIACGPISSTPPRRSARNFTEESNVHNSRIVVGNATCVTAGAREKRFELPTRRLRKCSSRV